MAAAQPVLIEVGRVAGQAGTTVEVPVWLEVDGLRVDRIVLEPTHESVDADGPGPAADPEGVAR